MTPAQRTEYDRQRLAGCIQTEESFLAHGAAAEAMQAQAKAAPWWTQPTQRKHRALAAGLSEADLRKPRGWLLPELGGVLDGWRYLHGKPGTGKTTQLTLMVRRHIADPAREWRCRLLTQAELLESLRPDGWGDLGYYQRVDLLCVDELGPCRTAWEAENMFAVLDGRYSRGLPTVLASNHPLESVGTWEGLGVRYMERIVERCGEGGVVEMKCNFRRSK